MTEPSPDLAESLRAAFNPSVLETVRYLWFQNVTDDTELLIPPSKLIKQWFTSDADFDKSCTDTFNEQLNLIRRLSEKNNLTAADLLAALLPLSPLDWLGLIILLDQVPRNCFRGQHANIAFSVFDPITLGVVMRAIEGGIPDTPDIRYRVGYRLWFYLPLQHSEKHEMQELSMREHARIFTDLRDLMMKQAVESHGSDEGVSMKLEKCREFLLKNKDGVDKWETMLVSFAARHKKVIDRFGRFPHRNEVLGRAPTQDEVRYLAEGGETFSSSQKTWKILDHQDG